MGNHPHLFRINNHHPINEEAQYLNNCRSSTIGFDNHMIIMCRLPLSESIDAVSEQRNASKRNKLPSQCATISAASRWISISISRMLASILITNGSMRRHENYGSALAAHPGKLQGRADNEVELSAHVRWTTCPHLRAPGTQWPRSTKHSALERFGKLKHWPHPIG